MSRQHYGYHRDDAELEPLDDPYAQPARAPVGNRQQYREQYPQQSPPPTQEYNHPSPYGQSPTRPLAQSPGRLPGGHPDSTFDRLRATRRNNRDISGSGGEGQHLYPPAVTPATGGYRQRDPVSPLSPPNPPPHRDAPDRFVGQERGYYTRQQLHQNPRPLSNTTPGADNFGESAAGGMAGIAYSVAERNARESGLEAMRGAPNYPEPAHQQHGQWQSHDRGYGQQRQHRAAENYDGNNVQQPDRDSHSSLAGLGAAAVGPGMSTPGHRTPSRSPHSFANEVYTDDPYQGYTRHQDPHFGAVNPNEIEDDDDEGLEYGRRGPRTSMLSLGGSSQRGRDGLPAATGTGAAPAAAGVMGTLGGLVGRNASHGYYGPVHNANTAYQGGGVTQNSSTYDLGSSDRGEKSEWLNKQNRGHKKWRWAIGICVAVVVAAGIACGVVFGVVLKKNNSRGSYGPTDTAAGDTAANGDLNINSAEIQDLLNNKDLHKVFPGVDYTPVNTQYPDCLSNPPSQNNVTRDVAVLSQMTNTIRLYGTDCNQTEMVIHALRQLKMQDTIKIWLGVWQDNNATTNARQLEQMWNILDQYGEKPFKGLIVANEILFREQMTAWELGQLLASVRANVTAKGMSLPVATSDLGDKWTADLAAKSDYVMANIHPFFGGIPSRNGASWTYSFWMNNNGPIFKADASKNVISETGWPSQGGTDCGTDAVTSCPDGSVATVDGMNTFMSDWVCQALANGTQYFWFEAFDEPWKWRFNQGAKQWEDHWGLLDVNRNLKSGIKIPDCGGKTI